MTSQAQPTGALDYRPELDGLRAFAVLTVMWFHGRLFVGRYTLTGGFNGVDVFFVLSGYLITTLLIREWGSTGSISIKNFYARRALRLLPALFLTLIFGAVVVALTTRPFGRPYWQSALAALSYVANWIQMRVNMWPLRHTWSLSVEEQYYLGWSAFLFLALRRGMSHRSLGFLAILGAVGMAIARFIAFESGEANFAALSTFTRPDSVLIGSSLALLLPGWPARLRGLLARRDVGVLVAALFVVGTAALNWRTPTYNRGGLFVYNVITALLISHMVLTESSLPKRVLSFRPLAGLGRISYAIYLFHVPMVSLISDHPVRRSGTEWLGVYVGGTIGLAVLSWFLVERPALRLKKRFGSMSRMPEVAGASPSR